MSNLIPDVTGTLRINTASAMSDYQNAMKNIRDAVASPGDLINRLIESNERDKRAAEEQKRYETELGFKQRQEGRVVDDLNRAQATREAVQAQLNPDMYRNSKLTEVDNAIQQSLANLSPQDRAIAEQEVARNYNRNASGNYVLDSARANVLADPTTVLSAQANQLNLRLKDPNSAEYKAAQQAEWDAAKRKMDYSHGLDIAKINMQERKQVEEGNRLAKLLGVGNTKTVTSNNKADIDEATRKNASLAYGQEQYGKEYGRLAETTPMLEGETMDAYGARLDAMTKNNLGISFANKITDYALVDVPELQQTTREVMLTPQEYSNVIYKQLEGNSVTPTMLNQANNAIKNYTDAYTKQNKVNSELAANSATLDDYKAIIDANGGNSKNITTIDGAKAKLKEIETKIKANSKNTGGGLADVLKATTTTGLDSDHLATIQAEAANRKISNKDLAALIELGDKPGDSLPVLSSTQRDYVLDALRQYPLK